MEILTIKRKRTEFPNQGYSLTFWLAHPHKYNFYQNWGESPPVCGNYVHIGRPYTRINNSVFKNPMSSMKKKEKKNLEIEKNQYLNKSKN